jgi:hypothetical protein
VRNDGEHHNGGADGFGGFGRVGTGVDRAGAVDEMEGLAMKAERVLIMLIGLALIICMWGG